MEVTHRIILHTTIQQFIGSRICSQDVLVDLERTNQNRIFILKKKRTKIFHSPMLIRLLTGLYHQYGYSKKSYCLGSIPMSTLCLKSVLPIPFQLLNLLYEFRTVLDRGNRPNKRDTGDWGSLLLYQLQKSCDLSLIRSHLRQATILNKNTCK